MKNLFGLDDKTETANSKPFVLRTINGSQAEEKINGVFDELRQAERSASLPIWLMILSFVLIFAGMIMIAVLGAQEGYEELKNAIIVATIGAVLTLSGLVILAINYLRLHKLKTSPNYLSLLEKQRKAEELCYKSLCIPDMAEYITILVSNSELKTNTFVAVKVKIFDENERLCFADEYEVIAVPLSQIATINSVKAKTEFIACDEKTAIKKRDAEFLGLKVNAHGNYIAPHRYSARVMHGAEEFEIILPPYEIEKFTKYANVKVIS